MAIRGPRSGTWSREQRSQDASTGPGARCLSLSSGPTVSCLCDFKRGTLCSMPQFPHPYRGQDVFTHMTGAFGPVPVLTGTTCGLSWAGKHGLRGHRGSWPSAGPGIVKEGTGQRQPVSRGCPQRVPSLCWASRARAWYTPGQDSICCPNGSFLSTCLSATYPLLPVRPEGSVLVSLGPSVSPVSSPGPSTAWAFRQSHSWERSQRAPYHPGGSPGLCGR